MISKNSLDSKSIDIRNIAIEKLKRFGKDHNRKEIEIREARKLLSQFRFNREKIDTLLYCLETDGAVLFKRRMKRLELL